MIITKLATIEDLVQIQEIEAECIDRPWSRLLLEADLSTNPNACYWAAFDSENPAKLLGFVGTHNIVGEINITNVAVRNEARRRGVGYMLLCEMLKSLEISSSNGEIIGVTLEVKVDNFTAIRLYEKLGFKEEGIRKAYYSDGKDAIIMWLRQTEMKH